MFTEHSMANSSATSIPQTEFIALVPSELATRPSEHAMVNPHRSGTGVYELKFVISSEISERVREWAHHHLTPDPHCARDVDWGYLVNSLYLDTPEFEVLRRGDGFRQRKYRLRRYGIEDVIWMELKQKNGGLVSKRRTAVKEDDLRHTIASPPVLDTPEGWFQNRLQKLKLLPICEVTYQRFACLGQTSSGPIRLTLDKDLCCRAANGWSVPNSPLREGRQLTTDQVLELKFQDCIPSLFRQLIDELKLTPATFSKYRKSASLCFPQLPESLTPTS